MIFFIFKKKLSWGKTGKFKFKIFELFEALDLKIFGNTSNWFPLKFPFTNGLERVPWNFPEKKKLEILKNVW
jgi:hypothetical protein